MPNNYVLLDRIELNNTAASVTFDNLGTLTGYTDLKIVYSARSDAATTDRGLFVRLNGDTGNNYSYRFLRGDGSAAGSGGSTTSFLYFGNFNAGTSTASTFGNGEFYIPNYKSSTQKSVSSDSVSENNATSAWTTLAAGLWTGTSAITTILMYPEGGNFVANSTFSLYGIAQVGTTPVIAPKADGGNVIGTDGTYWYHAFLSNGTFTPQTGLNCEVLAIAGGGGGGYDAAGGGGAGGVIYKSGATASTAQVITVGAGGPGATSSGSTAGGVNSTAFGMTAFGGGIGGPGGSLSGYAGGSGGGGGWGRSSGASTQTSNGGGTGYGNAGGNGGTNNYPGGGGGGAGAAAANCTTNAATAGGAGLNTWSAWASATGTGVSGYFAGGGGGGAVDASRATGGLGGGGNGAQAAYYLSPPNIAGSDAVVNTGSGGGGGGGGTAPSRQAGYNGGSGIVIIRYPVA